MPPEGFVFVFSDDRGPKRSEDMTREDLLDVIEYFRREQKRMYAQTQHDLKSFQ